MTIFPTLRYRDADAALDWLQHAFGLREHAVHRGPDGTVAHAELAAEGGMVMVGQVRPDDWMGGTTPDPDAAAHAIYVAVADVGAHHERATMAGADIIRPLTETDYGSREYAARDLEGNYWSFGTYDPTAP